MKIYLQTRGVAHDYAFLGEAPSDYWWASPFYKDATSFEQPSLILERGKSRVGEWRCFISAIPSKEYRDCVNTRIRYSIALSGDGQADTNVLLKLLASVLDIFSKNPVSENNSLTKLLDDEVGGHADEWLGVNSEQERIQIRDRINRLTIGFDKLKSDSGELSKLYNQLQELLTNVQNSPRRAAILNFIGEKDDPSARQLQSQPEASDGKILIFPSPVAGGQLKKSFVLEGNSFEKDINHTRHPVNESKAGLLDQTERYLQTRLKIAENAIKRGLSSTNKGSATEKDSHESFSVGPQGNNQTTEGHNIMGSSFDTSDVRGSRNGIVLMVAVTIVVALLVVAGCYLAQN